MPLKIEAAKDVASLENDRIRLEVRRTSEGLVERVFAWKDRWHQVLESRRVSGRDELDYAPSVDQWAVAEDSPEQAALRLQGARDGRRFTVTIRLMPDEPFAHYSVVEETSRRQKTRSLMSRYRFARPDVDFCFAPHLRPRHDDVVGQFAFKSPAIIVQSDATLAALIADVELINPSAPQPVCLEPDFSGYGSSEPTLAYGFKDHEPHGLIYFRHRPEMIVELENTTRTYGYRLLVAADCEPRYGYRRIVRLLWRLYGSENFRSGLPQVLPIDRYNDYALDYAIPTLWRDLPLGARDCGGMVMGIKFPNDIWFHFFFNHLHTAFGLDRMGRRRGRPDLVEKAEKIKNLILSAPRNDGAFPAIFSHQIITGIRHDEWIAHAHWVGGFIPYQTQISRPADQPAYSTMDGAWTSYWMLRWNAEIAAHPDLVGRARGYGELLLRSQLPSGAVPVWLHKDTLEPMDALRESPSCAAAGLLFAKLYEEIGDERFLDAAKRVASFIERVVMPQGWTDYECFFDSAGKPMDLRDPYSRQRPQCTFPIFWTAEMAKTLFRATREERYLQQALRAVDYLLLFQAVWSPPYLTVKGFGSIGIGNGHTGWNDARAGIFSPGISEFFSLTGEIEYLQRSVAAMRSPLALMYIPENRSVSSVFDKGPLGYADECYAHRGRDARLGPSTFDFSIGYALMAHEELFRTFGSAFVDLGAGHGVGIDGCTVNPVLCTKDRVEVAVEDTVSCQRQLTVHVRAPENDAREVRINGKAFAVKGQRQVEVQL